MARLMFATKREIVMNGGAGQCLVLQIPLGEGYGVSNPRVTSCSGPSTRLSHCRITQFWLNLPSFRLIFRAWPGGSRRKVGTVSLAL